MSPLAPPLPADVFVLLLAGGRGSRFWPLSRRALPKQCLSLDGGPTLLQRTVSRVLPIVSAERILVATGPDMLAAVEAQLPGVTTLVEPTARNTLPAIAWGVVEAAKRGAALLIVLPSDHLIADEAEFRLVLHRAVHAAEAGALVTIGILPTRPETGFGWMECGRRDDVRGRVAEHDVARLARPIRRFVEKPALADAERMLADGRHLWNAGMFVFRVDAFTAELATHAPRTASALVRLSNGASIAEVWPETDATSVDYGVMERAATVVAIPGNFGWSDIGSWNALADVLPAEPWGVGVAGTVIAEHANGNVVHAPGKVVALLGVEDLIVVDTQDALLVARKGDAQAVRHILAELERRGLTRHT